MGFPVGYSEVPNLLLHALFLLGSLRRILCWAFDAVGLGLLLDPVDTTYPDIPPLHARTPTRTADPPPTQLIDDLLPVARFDELGHTAADACAVCLHEFQAPEPVRRLHACRHVFHRGCLDPWIAHGHRTCPLCRTPLFSGGCAPIAGDEWDAVGDALLSPHHPLDYPFYD